jgi:fucose permease
VREPRQTLYLIALAAMFVFGMVLALPGTVIGLPEVAERLHLSLASRGVLISGLFLGLLLGSVVTGLLVDRVGHRAALGGSAFLIAVCLPLFAAAPTFALATVALAAIGMASAGVNTASNALSSDLFPEERGRRMNGLAVAVGAGGLSFPAAIALSAGHVAWSWIVWIGAALAVGVAVTAGMMNGLAPSRPRASRGAGGIADVVRQPGLVWIGLLLMLGGGSEASMAGFTSTYLSTLGVASSTATWALSWHWMGLIAGRLAFAGRVDRAKARAIVIASSAGAAAALVLVAASSPIALMAAPCVVGLAIGIIMPTGLALGGERYPRNAGTLFGVLLAVAQVGAMVLPAVIGTVSQQAGVRAGMGILVVSNMLIAAIAAKAMRPAR